MKPTSWKWQFASPQVAIELGEHPEQLLEQAQLIKENPVRKVFRTETLYLKQDCRKGHHLRHEWKCAECVVANGIPCVDYLALGCSSEGEVLITRAESNAVPVKDYVCMLGHQLEDGTASRETVLAFAESLAEFSLRIIEAKLIHTDYHFGNILYVPAEKRFCLVDTCGIRKANLIDRLFFSRWRMEKLVLGFNNILSFKEILHLYEIEKAINPLRSYERGMQDSVNHLRHSWKKRHKQILEGHHRYTVIEDNWLKVVDGAEHPWEPRDYEVQTGAPAINSQMLLADILMNACGIPHQRIYAFNRHTGELRLQKLCNPQPCHKVPDDCLIRLKCLEVVPRPEEWCMDATGHAILVDFKQICSIESRWNRCDYP